MQAMILAAGLGTRLKPLTDTLPKALIEINGQPLLRIIIEKLISYDFDKIIIKVHHFSGKIKEFLSDHSFAADIIISDESELLLDTGGGIKFAKKHFDDTPLLVHNVDIISDLNLKELYHAHLLSDASATLAVSSRNSGRYLLFNKERLLCGWEDVKNNQKIITRHESGLSRFAFDGIHILNPKIIGQFPAERVFSVIKAYLKLAPETKICGYTANNLKWLDTGKPENLDEAAKLIKEFQDSAKARTDD